MHQEQDQECDCGACVCVCVWLKAGLQPHLARVTLIRLWAGWGCTSVVQSNHGTQDKPAITTHTLRRESHCHGSTLDLLGEYHLVISDKSG